MSTPVPVQSDQPAMPRNGMGTAALVMGILQFLCLGTIGSILAVVFGKIGMTRADEGLATNRGAAKAGFVLGIIGIAMQVAGIIYFIAFLMLAPTISGMS